MKQASLSRSLASFTAGLSFEDLPVDVIELAKTRVLDVLSASFSGYDLAWSQIAAKLAGSGKGNSTVLGYGTKAAAMDAALANGVIAHSVLLEDCAVGAGHPGVVIVPAALAVAEEEQCSGADLITAIVAGYDIYIRIGLGLAGKWRPGFRAVPVLGAFGAAAAVGKLQKLNEEQMTSTLAYAANVASGTSEHWSYGTMEGMFHAGIAARNGILVTTLAKLGATGAETALEGQYGFYMAIAGSPVDAHAVTAELGNKFMITQVMAKRYPACGNHQAAIDLALTLQQSNQIIGNDIEKIIHRVNPRVKSSSGDDYGGPFANQFQAQMSAKFCVAAAILGEPVGSPALTRRHFDDPEIFALAKKVELVADESKHDYNPGIEVLMKDGKRFATCEDRESRFIPSTELMKEKFMSLASDFLGKRKAAAVMDAVMNLDKLDNIRKLTVKLRKR